MAERWLLALLGIATDIGSIASMLVGPTVSRWVLLARLAALVTGAVLAVRGRSPSQVH